MKKTLIAAALMALVATGASAKTATDSAAIAKNKPVFTVVKENPITSIKDQNRSGTCWAYSTLSYFESEILKKTGKTYDLSEMFVANKTYMDRATMAVRMHGDVSFSQGGSAYDVLYALKHYGIVPETAMPAPGTLTGDSLANFGEFFDVMTPYVEAVAKSNAKKISSAWKSGLQGIIDSYIGKTPEKFTYQGKQYTLSELKRFVSFAGARNIFGSLVVTTKAGIPVKIVFVRNRNKKSECLYILSTDASLEDAEIVRIYGNRWSIECFFKSSKSFLKLGTEFQSHNYGAMVSHTAIVFTRYTILEWIRRNRNDEKTYGELFFMFCEDIQDIDLTNALQSLMALFVEHIGALSADITSFIKSKVTEWMMSQASFIQALFGNVCWES